VASRAGAPTAIVCMGLAACTYSVPDVRGDSGSPFCASLSTTPLLCADFDEGSLAAGWEGVTMESATLVAELAPDAHRSAPNGARFAVRPVTTTGHLDAQAFVNYPQTVSQVHVELDVKIESLTPGEELVLAFIAAPSANLTITGIDASTTQASLVEDVSMGITRAWSVSPKIGQWVRIVVDVALAPNRSQIQLQDETGAMSTVVDAVLSNQSTSAPANLAVGVPFISTPTAGASIVIDNIVFDAK